MLTLDVELPEDVANDAATCSSDICIYIYIYIYIYFFSFCDRARVLIYILKNQLFALKYTLKHALIKIISTPTCFGHIGPSSGSCRAWFVKLVRADYICTSLVM